MKQPIGTDSVASCLYDHVPCRMPFRVVSKVGPRNRTLDGVKILHGRGKRGQFIIKSGGEYRTSAKWSDSYALCSWCFAAIAQVPSPPLVVTIQPLPEILWTDLLILILRNYLLWNGAVVIALFSKVLATDVYCQINIEYVFSCRFFF